MNVAVVVGTRPQFVKLEPLVRAKPEEVDLTVFHTMQHYDAEMGAPGCEHRSMFSSKPLGPPALGGMIDWLTSELGYEKRFDWVIVVGDCRSTLAGALAAQEVDLLVAHLEAGLRCGKQTVEERIRYAVDHHSELALCPTLTAARNLQRESYSGKIAQVGDILVDALQGQRVLCTIHRQENEHQVPRILEMLQSYDATWVSHHRTASQLSEPGKVRVLPPQTRDEMLLLIAKSAVVVTDSGGLSREASLLSKPVLLVRSSYEFPEVECERYDTATVGATVLKAPIQELGEKLWKAVRQGTTQLGRGYTSELVWAELKNYGA